MKHRIFAPFALALAASLTAAALAQSATQPVSPASPDAQSATQSAATQTAATPAPPADPVLAGITQRGTMLAIYDQAVWHATDAVLATQPPRDKIQRYIARQTAVGWTVDFGRLNPDSTAFLTAYEAIQTDAPTHFALGQFDPPRQDTGFNLFAARAIDLVLHDFAAPAAHPYNVAVLPSEPTGLLVYLYPAQTKPGVYPYGGDVRYLVSPDGTKILDKHPMHKSILESTPAQIPAGATPAAGYHTHVLTDMPEDTDVFLVLSRQPRVPEYVSAGGHIYKINTDGSITRDPPDAPPAH